MCAICDANVAHEVFNLKKQPPSGKIFFDWITPKRPLIIGGKLTKELFNKDDLKRWASVAINDGSLLKKENENINKAINNLKKEKLKSNDPHIIALAKVSGARLLYSEDGPLIEDFTNKELINNPRGKIYPKGKTENALKRWLQQNKSLCSTEF